MFITHAKKDTYDLVCNVELSRTAGFFSSLLGKGKEAYRINLEHDGHCRYSNTYIFYLINTPVQPDQVKKMCYITVFNEYKTLRQWRGKHSAARYRYNAIIYNMIFNAAHAAAWLEVRPVMLYVFKSQNTSISHPHGVQRTLPLGDHQRRIAMAKFGGPRIIFQYFAAHISCAR